MVKEHNQFIVAMMVVLDLVVTACAWPVCYFLRFETGFFSTKGPVIPDLGEFTDIILISLLLVGLFFSRMGLYQPRRMQTLRREAFDILRACVCVWGVLLVASYFLRSALISRKLLGMFLVLWPVMLIGYRGAVRLTLRRLRRRGTNMRSVAIVGTGRTGQRLIHTLRQQNWTGYDICYLVEDRRAGGWFLDIPVLGPVAEIDRILDAHPVDAVFIALPHNRWREAEGVLNKLSERLVDVNVVPDLLWAQFLRHEMRQVGTLPVVNLTHSAQTGWNAAAKRVLDVLLSAVALAVLAIPMAIIALLVKRSSPGPVFYRQKRASVGGREFEIIKFRSMVADDDADPAAAWGVDDDDPRVTRVGRVLRKWSLDELPQFINVLNGDMSLVGPRPEQPGFIERFTRQFPRYALRHHVKAGITGWAQVNGFRGRSSLQKRIQYDLDYINRWSLGFDLWILMLTVVRCLIRPQGQ